MRGMLENMNIWFPLWFFKLPRMIELQDFNLLASKTNFESPKTLNPKLKQGKTKSIKKIYSKTNLKLTKKWKRERKLFELGLPPKKSLYFSSPD